MVLAAQDWCLLRNAQPALRSVDVEDAASLQVLLMRRMEERGTTQAELAQMLGVHQSTVSRWLAGGAVNEDVIEGLADYLGISEVELWKSYLDARKVRRRAHKRGLEDPLMAERIATLEGVVDSLTDQVGGVRSSAGEQMAAMLDGLRRLTDAHQGLAQEVAETQQEIAAIQRVLRSRLQSPPSGPGR